jgi:hypothetical protein
MYGDVQQSSKTNTFSLHFESKLDSRHAVRECFLPFGRDAVGTNNYKYEDHLEEPGCFVKSFGILGSPMHR